MTAAMPDQSRDTAAIAAYVTEICDGIAAALRKAIA